MSAPQANEGGPPRAAVIERDLSFDVYKGIAILAVLLHHVSGGIGIRNTVPGSFSHLLAVTLNRSLLFCVPAFLFLTVFLLTHSLMRRPMAPVAFWRKRFPRILGPYLIWTVFYACYNVATGQTPSGKLSNPASWWYWIVYGKANFHLYFLVIVLQVYVVLPDLVESLRDRPEPRKQSVWMSRILALICIVGGYAVSHPIPLRPLIHAGLIVAIYYCVREEGARAARRGIPLWGWLAGAYVAQIVVYFVHKFAIRSSNPATLLIWYVVIGVMGVVSALQYEEFRVQWPRMRLILGLLTLAAFVAFLPDAIRQVDGRRIDPFRWVALYWVFTGLASFWLLGFSRDLADRSPHLARPIAALGIYSMDLYLIHPAILSQVTRIHVHGSTLVIAGWMLLVFAGVTAATLGIAIGLRKLRLGPILFGR